jgi:hypothetical protein
MVSSSQKRISEFRDIYKNGWNNDCGKDRSLSLAAFRAVSERQQNIRVARSGPLNASG